MHPAAAAAVSSPGSIDPAASREIAGLLARLALLVGGAGTEAVSLERWRNRVLERYRPPKPRSTRDRYDQALRELVDLAGPEATTEALTPELVERFADWCAEQGKAPATTNGLLRAIRKGCNDAVSWGWLAASPFGEADCDPWQDEEPVDRHVPRADLGRLLASLRASSSKGWESHRLWAVVSVWAYAGLRRNEALCLRVEDLDLGRRLIRVRRTQGRRLKTRTSAAPVPMPEVLARTLESWLPAIAGSTWAFPGVRRRGPWTGGAAGKRAGDQLRAAGEAVGVADLTPHRLRHSLGTHLVGWWGLTEAQAGQILRHAGHEGRRATATRLYIHADAANLVELVAGFDYESGRPRRSPRRRRDRSPASPPGRGVTFESHHLPQPEGRGRQDLDMPAPRRSPGEDGPASAAGGQRPAGQSHSGPARSGSDRGAEPGPDDRRGLCRRHAAEAAHRR